jgi:hypothetical protein
VAHHAGINAASKPTINAVTRTVPRRTPVDSGQMKRFDRMSSAIAAWICMPGILKPVLPPENGVSNTSYNPAAVTPTNTILSVNIEGSTSGFSAPRISCSDFQRSQKW